MRQISPPAFKPLDKALDLLFLNCTLLMTFDELVLLSLLTYSVPHFLHVIVLAVTTQLQVFVQ